MATIYLKHPIHGGKVCSTDIEASHDRANGWVDFDPHEVVAPPLPSFLTTPLPADFPARDWLVEAGFSTVDSIADKTSEQLQQIKGIGQATALRILDILTP